MSGSGEPKVAEQCYRSSMSDIGSSSRCTPISQLGFGNIGIAASHLQLLKCPMCFKSRRLPDITSNLNQTDLVTNDDAMTCHLDPQLQVVLHGH